MTLHIEHLTKKFGNNTAVHDISFTLPEGEVLGLLGRNGAGKSTTIKILLELLQPDNGTITWNGKPWNRKNLSIGYLPEERGLYPKTKIAEQLHYFAQLDGMEKSKIDKKIDYWLERFGITDYKNKTAGELSKGNQQKIQLIATLLHDPDIIILDEPFSGLDPVNASMLSDVLMEEINRKKTIILSSHRMEQIEMFCKNICMMKDGEMVLSGNLQEIKENYGYRNLTFSTPEPIDHLFSTLSLSFEKNDTTYTTKVKNDKEALYILNTLVENNVSYRNFSMIEPTLNEIFIERTK